MPQSRMVLGSQCRFQYGRHASHTRHTGLQAHTADCSHPRLDTVSTLPRDTALQQYYYQQAINTWSLSWLTGTKSLFSSRNLRNDAPSLRCKRIIVFQVFLVAIFLSGHSLVLLYIYILYLPEQELVLPQSVGVGSKPLSPGESKTKTVSKTDAVSNTPHNENHQKAAKVFQPHFKAGLHVTQTGSMFLTPSIWANTQGVLVFMAL